MTKSKILQEITSVLINMGIPPKAITKHSSYYNDLGLDSLDIAEMILEFELRLDLSLSCIAFEQIKTINDTVDYINKLKNIEARSSVLK